MPDIPAPPMPTKCTRPRLADGRCARARRHAHDGEPSRPRASTMSASRSSASRTPRVAAARPIAASRSRVEQQRQQRARASTAACRPRRRRAGRRRPSTTGSALRRCSPLPIGSGTYTAGSPTAVSSAHGRHARPGTAPGRRRRRRGPSGRSTSTRTYGRGRRRRLAVDRSAGVASARPTCSTCDARREQGRRRRPATAR